MVGKCLTKKLQLLVLLEKVVQDWHHHFRGEHRRHSKAGSATDVGINKHNIIEATMVASLIMNPSDLQNRFASFHFSPTFPPLSIHTNSDSGQNRTPERKKRSPPEKRLPCLGKRQKERFMMSNNNKTRSVSPSPEAIDRSRCISPGDRR